MIIFDTNAINHLPPDGVKADIIRKLRESGHYRVAVPWMVLEEMAAHQAAFYPVRHQAVLNTLQGLQELLPWEVQSSLEPFDMERLVAHWRARYSDVFEVIETSGESARRALAREAVALPPAARCKDHSKGSRDAAIWFSIIEFLKANPEESVCLVTDNTNDFGDGKTYPYPMNEDIAGLEERLTRLSSFEQVVSEYTKEVSGESAVTAAGDLLKAVRPAIASHADLAHNAVTGYGGLTDDDSVAQWREWVAAPDVELLSVAEVTGHEIAGDIWYTAKVRWLLYGLAVDSESVDDSRYVSCIWETKVLFSTRDGERTASLLSQEPPQIPDTTDKPLMQALEDLRERVKSAAQLKLRSAAKARYGIDGAALSRAIRWANLSAHSHQREQTDPFIAAIAENGALSSVGRETAARLIAGVLASQGDLKVADLAAHPSTALGRQWIANLLASGALSVPNPAVTRAVEALVNVGTEGASDDSLEVEGSADAEEAAEEAEDPASEDGTEET